MDNTNLGVRQLPQNLEIERALLGTIFVSDDPITTFEIINGQIRKEDFYSLQHQAIFEAMGQLAEQSSAIDVQLINDQLTKTKNIDNAGGLPYLIQLFNTEPTAANAENYAQTVHQLSLQRQLIRQLTQSVSEAYEPEQGQDMDEVIGHIADSLNELQQTGQIDGFTSIQEALDLTLKQVNERVKNPQRVTGLPSGFKELDKLTTGFQPNQLIVLAARPGVGKTAFVLNLALNAAKHKSKDTNRVKPVVIFNMEMNVEQLTTRILAIQSGVDMQKIATGDFHTDTNQDDKTDWQRLFTAQDKLANSPIQIDDTPGANINSIRAKLRRLAKENQSAGGLGLVIIDYLQLIEGNSRESRQQAVAEISRSLKKLSMELSVPIIALSQLSRGVESRNDRRPMLSDLRESGAIEQDADIVAFLYRDDYYDRENQEEESADFSAFPAFDQQRPTDPDQSDVEVIVEKNRQGARDTVVLRFIKSKQQFLNISMQQPLDNQGKSNSNMPPIPPMPETNLNPF